MAWVGLALFVTLTVVAIAYLLIGFKGVRSIETDGWSPMETVLGRKFTRKRNRRGDAE